jgi:site-specific DNA-cytosine methylase
MIHLDLFSGIGGFAYAIDQVWDGVEHIFCDNDKFCQQVLKKHWPNSKIYGDIRELTALPTYGSIKLYENTIQPNNQNVSKGAINPRNSKLLRSDKTGDVENYEETGLPIQRQQEIWQAKSFLSGNESGGQSTKPIRTSIEKGHNRKENSLRNLRVNGKVQEWTNSDTGSSFGLSETIGDSVAMSKMSSRMAQTKQSEKIIYETKNIGTRWSGVDILTGGFP